MGAVVVVVFCLCSLLGNKQSFFDDAGVLRFLFVDDEFPSFAARAIRALFMERSYSCFAFYLA